jgi:hypothetical protein
MQRPKKVRALTAAGLSVLHFATYAVTGHPEISGVALSMVNREGKQDDIFW